MPLSVRLFEETLGSDEATTKRATLLWSRIEKFAIDIKGVSGDALERLKLLVLCIAAITLQYDKQEEAFSELLNATFGSSGELRGKKLPRTFIEYREAELRANERVLSLALAQAMTDVDAEEVDNEIRASLFSTFLLARWKRVFFLMVFDLISESCADSDTHPPPCT